LRIGPRLLLLPLLALGAAGAPRAGALLEWRGGLEVEGRRESFGFESLFGPDEVVVSADSSGSRFREREIEALAVFGVDLRPAGGSAGNGVDLELRAGATRRSLALDAAGTVGRPLTGLVVRNQLTGDDEDERGGDPLRSVQDLLSLRWAPGGSGWRPSLRGALDLSWAEAGESADTLAAIDARYLRYRRVSLGLGLLRGAYGERSLFVQADRKWIEGGTPGAYEGLTLHALGAAGGWDLDVRLERRRYLGIAPDSLSGALAPYWEAEGYAIWARRGPRWGLEATTRASGTRFDRRGATPDSSESAAIAALDADRLELATEWMVRRSAAIECAAGLTGDQLWLRRGSGEYHALGARLEASAHAGPALGEGWLELAIEAGRRDYRGGGGSLNFDFEGLSLSLAQSDYTYFEGSIIGGGKLPLGAEWQIFASLDREEHDRPEDDGLLFSCDLTVLRRWGPPR
jgi:hypothetical protein